MMDYQTYENSLHRRRQSEPSRGYLWAIELPNLGVAPANASKADSFAAAYDDISNAVEPVDMQLLNTLVTSVSAPLFSFDTDKVTDGNTFWYRATHNDISNISITFEEQQNGMVWKYLNSWKNLIIHSNGGYNPPSYYKRSIILHRLDLSKRAFQTFTYSGYFISDVPAVDNSYTSSDPTSYTATFTGDSLVNVKTKNRAEVERSMEDISNRLGNIDIPFDRFNFEGVPADSIQNILTTIAARAI